MYRVHTWYRIKWRDMYNVHSYIMAWRSLLFSVIICLSYSHDVRTTYSLSRTGTSYNVQLSLYSVHLSLYSVHLLLYNVHLSLYSVHLSLYSVHLLLFSVHLKYYTLTLSKQTHWVCLSEKTSQWIMYHWHTV